MNKCRTGDKYLNFKFTGAFNSIREISKRLRAKGSESSFWKSKETQMLQRLIERFVKMWKNFSQPQWQVAEPRSNKAENASNIVYLLFICVLYTGEEWKRLFLSIVCLHVDKKRNLFRCVRRNNFNFFFIKRCGWRLAWWTRKNFAQSPVFL